MFEDSTFESMGKTRTCSRGWMLAALALNSAILLALVLIPLLDPEALPRMAESILMQAPPPPIEPLKPQTQPAGAVVAHSSSVQDLQAPSVILKTIAVPDNRVITTAIDTSNWSNLPYSGAGSPDSPFNGQSNIKVVQQSPQPLKPVSSTVMEGMIVYKVPPAYPSIAIATGTSGTVVLQATISKNGKIEGLRVVSGPTLLQQAAIDAVKQWRYRPYLLNGEPIEVETTVTVIFKLS